MTDDILIERLSAARDRPFLTCTEDEYLEDERAAYEFFKEKEYGQNNEMP